MKERERIMFTLPRNCDKLDGNIFLALRNIPGKTRRIIAMLLLYIRNSDDVDIDDTAEALSKSAVNIVGKYARRRVFPHTDQKLEDISNCRGRFSIEKSAKFTPDEEHIYNMLRGTGRNTLTLICVIKALSLIYDLDVLDVENLTYAAEKTNAIMDRCAEPDDPDIEEKIAKAEAEPVIDEPIEEELSAKEETPVEDPVVDQLTEPVQEEPEIATADDVLAAFKAAHEEKFGSINGQDEPVSEPEVIPAVQEITEPEEDTLPEIKAPEPVIEDSLPDPAEIKQVMTEPEQVKKTPVIETAPVIQDPVDPLPVKDKKPIKHYTAADIPEFRRQFLRVMKETYGIGKTGPFTDDEFNSIQKDKNIENLFKQADAEFKELEEALGNKKFYIKKKLPMFESAEEQEIDRLLNRGRYAYTMFWNATKYADDGSLKEQIRHFEEMRDVVKALRAYE